MRNHPFLGLALALLCTACSDPKCPGDLIQRGKVCRRCPEDSMKVGNNCISNDGGVIVEPVEGGGKSDDAGTGASWDPRSDGGVVGMFDPSAPDASGDAGPPAISCNTDAMCGDADRFHCVNKACVEYPCSTSKFCEGAFVCRDHACVAFTPPERLPTAYFQSSGGGTASSSRYRLRWTIGMPQPMGVSSNTKHRLTLGPGAGRP